MAVEPTFQQTCREATAFQPGGTGPRFGAFQIVPVLGPMEALVKVGACGLNNTDVNTRTGWYSRTVTHATTGDALAEVYYTQGPRSFFRLHEKGGRYNVVPAHHVAQGYVDAYLEVAHIAEDRRGPLFRSCEPGRRDVLQERRMSRAGASKMIKRRARKAGLPAEICAHSFRATGITEYLRNGGDLEVAARIAGHESTRTTQLYNRLREEISLDEIERIHI